MLSLSWCAQDNDILISCGKDNRTVCWNPQTGEIYGEYPVVTNWTFQTRWNPHNPSLSATASFDGKITVYPLQSTSVDARQHTGAPSQAVDDVDFFNTPQVESQRNTFSLPKAPKWLRRPCGVTFGFGGKVVSFNVTESAAHPGSKVRISNFAVDVGIGDSSIKFEKAIQDKDLAGICRRQRSEELDKSERLDWTVIETLTSQHPRKELIQYLGFSAEAGEAADGISKLTVNGDQGNDGSAEKPQGVSTARQNRLSAFFENNSEEDSFLSSLAATKGAKINNPFQVYSGSESESDRNITRALLLGQFDRALDICLQEDRLSDAFMVSICGGQDCIEKAQKAYFNRKTGGPNYLRLLASVVGKNLWDIVYNADLANWKEVMAAMCTYANAEEFPDLCEALGDRLDEHARNGEGPGVLRQDASFCYLAGSKLEKVVGVWISELEHREESQLQNNSNDSSFGIHARTLQHFIEKVTVFREATNFRDRDLQATSDWKLGLLYDKYTEYADLVASFGQLRIAERYLDLLPKHYPAAEAARERIRQATRGQSTENAPKQPLATGRAPLHNQAGIGQVGTGTHSKLNRPTPDSANPYEPASTYQTQSYPHMAQVQHKPPGYADNVRYGPVQQPRQPQFSLQAQAPSYPNQSVGPPPRTVNASPSIPAPSRDPNMGNWNDMPESFFRSSTSRRPTPGAPVQSTNPMYGYASAAAASGMPPPVGGQQKSTPPLPPPPKGPPRTNSPMIGSASTQNIHNRPSSSAANSYAPQAASNPAGAGQQQPMIPRGASPYNPPPSAAPPSNRYAPAPNAPKEAYPLPGAHRYGPPPTKPYAPPLNHTDPGERHVHEQAYNTNMTRSTEPPSGSSGPPRSAIGGGGAEATQSPQVGITHASPVHKHRKFDHHPRNLQECAC